MFDGSDFPQSLDEDQFDDWLEKGRNSKIRYSYLLILWNEQEGRYLPIYAENRDAFAQYEQYNHTTRHESLVAVYDLYSESRIQLH